MTAFHYVVPGILLCVGLGLLSWDRHLKRRMTDVERKEGFRRVRRLYMSWQFIFAFVLFMLATSGLMNGRYEVLGLSVLGLCVSVPLAVKRWRELKTLE